MKNWNSVDVHAGVAIAALCSVRHRMRAGEQSSYIGIEINGVLCGSRINLAPMVQRPGAGPAGATTLRCFLLSAVIQLGSQADVSSRSATGRFRITTATSPKGRPN
jgi:hypothetical protein